MSDYPQPNPTPPPLPVFNPINWPQMIQQGGGGGVGIQGIQGEQGSSPSLPANVDLSDPIRIGTDAGDIAQSLLAIAIGRNAAMDTQSSGAIAIGYEAGKTTQGINGIAIGYQAGQGTQTQLAVAIGEFAGNELQGEQAVALGYWAGQTTQASQAIAIGTNAGSANQQTSAVAIGTDAGYNAQGLYAVAIGHNAGYVNQGDYSIALGFQSAGLFSQSQAPNSIILNASGSVLDAGTTGLFVKPVREGATGPVVIYDNITGEMSYFTGPFGGGVQGAQGDVGFQGWQGYVGAQGSSFFFPEQIYIGNEAGNNDGTTQSVDSIAIGIQAASAATLTVQGPRAIAIGFQAGRDSQQNSAIAIGGFAGEYNQGNSAVAIGEFAGQWDQGYDSVAIGRGAGYTGQGQYAVAIGGQAGQPPMGQGGICIGYNSAGTGTDVISIGQNAGDSSTGANCIFIGKQAGITSTASNSIALTATNAGLVVPESSAFYVDPIRNLTTADTLYYDTSTKEITYGVAPSGGGGGDDLQIFTAFTTSYPNLASEKQGWRNTLAFTPIGWYTGVKTNATGKIMIACSQNVGNFWSQDYGESWSSFTGGNGWSSCIKMSASGQYIMVAGNYSTGINISTDYGNTFTIRFNTIGNLFAMGISASGDLMYAFVGTTLYKSVDYGVNWTVVNTVGDSITKMCCSYTGQYIYAGGGSLGFMSNDYGASFTAVFAGYTNNSMNGTGQYILAHGYGFTTLISRDYGVTFTALGIDVPFSNWSASGQYCVLGNNGSTLYISTDYGKNFVAQPTETFDFNISDQPESGLSISANGQYIICMSGPSSTQTALYYSQPWTLNKYFAQVSDVSSQVNTGATGINMAISTLDVGVGIQFTPNHISFDYQGWYSISYSVQFVNTGSQEQVINVWLVYNDIIYAEPKYNRQFGITKSMGGVDGKTVATSTFVLFFYKDETLDLYWQCDDTNVSIEYIPATAWIPETPSVFLNAQLISFS